MEYILYRRKSEQDSWEKAPIECQTDKQEAGWLYRYLPDNYNEKQ